MMSTQLEFESGNAAGTRPARDMVQLASDEVEMPPDLTDREAGRALWPLLLSGSPRTLLLGKLVVGLGIDSATAGNRLDRTLSELSAQGYL